MAQLDRSWGRAIIACIATLLSTSVHSTSGFFYVEFMRLYRLNREKGSWPTCVSQAMQEGSALIVALLQDKIPVSTLGLFGSVLFWSGIFASQWAPSITWMTFTFGCVQGAGSGIVSLAVTILLMKRFDKYRATAIGIRYAGFSLSALIYPPILSQLRAAFSFRQMCLLLGGISLNTTPLVYTLREDALKRDSRCLKRGMCEISKQMASSDAAKLGHTLRKNTPTPTLVSSKEESPLEKGSTSNRSIKAVTSAPIPVLKPIETESLRSEEINSSASAETNQEPRSSTIMADANSESPDNASTEEQVETPSPAFLLRPAFWLVVLGSALTDYSEEVFLATIVDSAMDHGATINQAGMSIMCSAPSQLFGRAALPFLADMFGANRTALASACYLLFSGSIALLGVTRAFSSYAPCEAVAWVSLGCLTTVKHVVAADHFGVDVVSAAWASTGVIVLPMLISNPAILGFFRDKHGSYNHLYHLLASVHFVMGVMFLLLRCSTLKREKGWIIEHKEKSPHYDSRTERFTSKYV